MIRHGDKVTFRSFMAPPKWDWRYTTGIVIGFDDCNGRVKVSWKHDGGGKDLTRWHGEGDLTVVER